MNQQKSKSKSRSKDQEQRAKSKRPVSASPRLRVSASFFLALCSLLLAPCSLLAQPAAAPSPTPAEIGTWVNVGMLFLNGAVAIVTILSVNRKARREVTFAFEPASKEEFDKVVDTIKSDMASLREQMRQDRDVAQAAQEKRTIALHERINQILAAVSELRGRIEAEREK